MIRVKISLHGAQLVMLETRSYSFGFLWFIILPLVGAMKLCKYIGSFERLFGFQLQNNCEKELFINSLLLSARFLIYRCKYSGTKPNMLQYFNLLNNIKSTEYLIAKRNNKIAIHFRKWAYL